MKGHAIPAAPAGAAQLHGAAISLQLLVYIICTAPYVIIQIMHYEPGQYSNVPMISLLEGHLQYSNLIIRHTPTPP